MFESQVNQVSLLAAFLAGVVSFISPCVLPLVPSYVTFITGVSFDELTAGGAGPRVRRLTIIHSLAFILGFSPRPRWRGSSSASTRTRSAAWAAC